MSAREIALGQIAQRLATNGPVRLDPGAPEVQATANRVLDRILTIAKDMRMRLTSVSLPKGLPEELLRPMRKMQEQFNRTSLVVCFTIHGIDKATAEQLVDQEVLQPA